MSRVPIAGAATAWLTIVPNANKRGIIRTHTRGFIVGTIRVH